MRLIWSTALELKLTNFSKIYVYGKSWAQSYLSQQRESFNVHSSILPLYFAQLFLKPVTGFNKFENDIHLLFT